MKPFTKRELTKLVNRFAKQYAVARVDTPEEQNLNDLAGDLADAFERSGLLKTGSDFLEALDAKLGRGGD